MTIEAILDGVIEREKGYVNHPDDRGGPTNWGITLATLSEWRKKPATEEDVKTLTRSEAKSIYRRMYVEKPGFEQVLLLSEKIADELVDTGVNMGPRTATMFLQRALNALNAGAAHYTDVATDGVLGPSTMSALAAYLRKRGAVGEIVMLRVLNSLQGARYIEIAERDRRQEAFVYGWFRERVVI